MQFSTLQKRKKTTTQKHKNCYVSTEKKKDKLEHVWQVRQRHEECEREKMKGKRKSGTAGRISPTVSLKRLEDTQQKTTCLRPSHAFTFHGG